MNDETRLWLSYAEENLQSAELLWASQLWNPCLQNAQQAVEKFLKALLLAHALPLKRTHSINELVRLLAERGTESDLTEDQCDLLGAIYLPTKYPLGSALPQFVPDNEAYLRLVGQQGAEWQDRAHFFAVASQVMRHLLVDHARARQLGKRGGGARLAG